jgi:hypothetical protein
LKANNDGRGARRSHNYRFAALNSEPWSFTVRKLLIVLTVVGLSFAWSPAIRSEQGIDYLRTQLNDRVYTPYALLVTDLDHDKIPDLVQTNFYQPSGSTYVPSLVVRLGLGNGVFSRAHTYPIGKQDQGDYPSSIAAGDLNGDGNLDLVVTNYGVGTLSILLGRGDGTFFAGHDVTSLQPHHVAIGDLNNDGNLDLAVAEDQTNYVSIFLGRGDGTFLDASAANGTRFDAGHRPHAVAIGDFNGDGNADLAIAVLDDSSIAVRFGNGNGTFREGTTLTSGAGPHHLIAVDLNHDGHLDLVSADSVNATISVFLGNGAGAFARSAQPLVTQDPLWLAAGDFDLDGNLDIAVASLATNTIGQATAKGITVLLGKGDGTFKDGINLMTRGGAYAIGAGDFDRDGIPDLAVTNVSQISGPNDPGVISVFLSRSFHPRLLNGRSVQ